jgi:hypothetical protein
VCLPGLRQCLAFGFGEICGSLVFVRLVFCFEPVFGCNLWGSRVGGVDGVHFRRALLGCLWRFWWWVSDGVVGAGFGRLGARCFGNVGWLSEYFLFGSTPVLGLWRCTLVFG